MAGSSLVPQWPKCQSTRHGFWEVSFWKILEASQMYFFTGIERKLILHERTGSLQTFYIVPRGLNRSGIRTNPSPTRHLCWLMPPRSVSCDKEPRCSWGAGHGPFSPSAQFISRAAAHISPHLLYFQYITVGSMYLELLNIIYLTHSGGSCRSESTLFVL